MLARQAAAAEVQNGEVASWDVAPCSNRAAWLRPPGARAAAAATATSGASRSAATPAAAAAAAADLRQAAHLGAARGITSSSRAQHNPQPAHEEAPAAAAAPEGQRHERTCWQCGTPLATHDLFFCPECKSVQPASMDVQYFQVFDM